MLLLKPVGMLLSRVLGCQFSHLLGCCPLFKELGFLTGSVTFVWSAHHAWGFLFFSLLVRQIFVGTQGCTCRSKRSVSSRGSRCGGVLALGPVLALSGRPAAGPQVSGSPHCQTHVLLPAARAGGGGSVHPLPLGKEAPLQTLALRREPGSSPDARGPVRPPSLVGTRVLACPAALRSRRPPATSAFVHDGKFLLLSYRRITFVEEMHDFNLKRFVYCVWAGLRAHAGSASMARVLGTIPPEPGHCVPGTHHRGMNTLG
uniref:Uncharacterized protein n=1 Tax=Rousettus aegyptiacus TaxID=9407 RepID=A0A7J8HSV7_ROUAE|nr:hypothetical protein HJG63_011078 [Rousettus aegyptiacus]